MGLLITVEGGDYTGKTSVVVPIIANFFKRHNIPTLTSREPGGTQKGEVIRKKIFDKIATGAPALEMAILFNVARQNHLNEVIIPFLGKKKEKNKIVILDRYLDSTRIYQGLEGGLSNEKILDLEKRYVGNYLPDLTLILYIPEDRFSNIMQKRMQSKRVTTNWDKQTIDEHLSRQKHYLKLPEIAKNNGEPRNFIFVDASETKKQIEIKIAKICQPYLRKFD